MGEDNQHLTQYDIRVLPARRRQGIGTALLRSIAQHTRDKERHLLVTGTLSTVPSGEAVMRHLGAQAGLESNVSELRLPDVDRGLMRSWIERARERAPGFELGFWEGRYPQDRLDEVASMLNAFNTQPTGDIDVEDRTYTVEDARSLDDMWEARGFIKWTCFVREPETGEIAGFTEVYINPQQPAKIEQGLTAVFPRYRNRGIGRWLKAAVVEKVLAEVPEAKVISTDNATINQPMLNINREMGFHPVKSETVWQVPLEEVETYLAARQGDSTTL
jgi:GNAT superfamily N-acetyltransferase